MRQILWTMLVCLMMAATSADAAESAYRFFSIAREGGGVTGRRSETRRNLWSGSHEARWNDFFERMWLPSLGPCDGGKAVESSEGMSLVDPGRPPIRIAIEGRPTEPTSFADRRAKICAIALQGEGVEGKGRVFIEADGLRPLAASFHLRQRLVPTPWEAAQGAATIVREIEAAWSVIP